MAILEGNPYGRLIGTLAQTVGGAARGRRGKLNTIRTKVTPANPNTTDQVTQRTKFRDCLDVTRDFGPEIYQSDLNRAIGELPGFQSTMSVLLSSINESYVFSAPPSILLGDVHVPSTFDASAGVSGGDIKVDWSTELGDNGNDNDKLIVVAYEANPAVTGERHRVWTIPAGVFRSVGTTTMPGFQEGVDVVVWAWFQGSSDTAGLLSNTMSDVGTSGES